MFSVRFLWFLVALALAFTALVARGYWNAMRDPIVRHANVHVADWPENAKPVKILLLSDIHISGPDMPPARVARIAGRLNNLKPDLIAIAGDLVSEKRLATQIYTVPEIIAPLKQFRAPLGVVVAMGNHDHWFAEDAFRNQIPQAGLTLLANQAVKRGPLVIGGVDDDFSGHADIEQTFAAMNRLDGPQIVLSHSPDIVPRLPRRVAVVLAGHTHCGQALLPISRAPIADVSRYGPRFRCGAIVDRGQRVIVAAGLGTSGIWLRYNAPPDVWLITLGP
jgi:uncharacterized protein